MLLARPGIPRPRAAAARAVAVTLALGSLVAHGTPAWGVDATTRVLRPWSLQNEQGGYDVPRDQALRDAAEADLITAHQLAYGGDVPAMKEVNPHLLVLGYVNATFAQTTEGTAYPAGWYLRDAGGAKVRNRVTGNFMMDPGNSGWIATRVAACRSRVQDLGYDGCDLDVLGLAPLSASYVTAPAIDPRTGSPWSKVDWIDATAALAREVTGVMRGMGKQTVGNGLSMGHLYYDPTNPTRKLLHAMDGGMAEAWLRGAQAGVDKYRSEMGWKKDVDMLVDAEARGKALLALTKMWVPATQAQKDSWRTYSLASFLLGAGGRSHFYYSDSFGANRTAGHDWYDIHLGAPLAAYAKVDGAYQRPFGRGRVLVNPTPAPVTVPLGTGTYRTIDGRSVSGSAVLPPNSAEILRAVG